MRTRKGNYKFSNYIGPLSLVVLLNLLGISYAGWQENLQFSHSVSTGEINPVFLDSFTIDSQSGSGELTVRFENNQTMVVEGKVDPNYAARINYGLKNAGTIPVKYIGLNQSVPEGLALQLDQQPAVLEPEATSGQSNSPYLSLQTVEPGTYNFEVKLLYEQWLNN